MQIPVDLNDINKRGDGARAQRDILTSFVPPAHIASSCLENIAPSVIPPHLHRNAEQSREEPNAWSLQAHSSREGSGELDAYDLRRPEEECPVCAAPTARYLPPRFDYDVAVLA